MTKVLRGFILLLLFAPLCSKAQFTRSLIKRTADERVKQMLGNVLFTHAYNADDMRYTYTDDSGRIQTAHIDGADTITKGRLDQIYINYVFEFKYPELKDTTIYGEFNIVLDRSLQTVRPPDLAFIPEYLYHIKENDFLPRAQIAKIAVEHGLDSHKPGMQYFSSIEHLKGLDKFAYVLKGEPEQFNLRSKDYEVMVIDAYTGVVMLHAFGDEAREKENKLRGR